MIIYGALAILFQPFFKIALGRELWNIVDVIVEIGLILSIWISPKLKQAHLQAAASPRSNQSLQKSLLCRRQEKNKKNLPRFAKIKSADTLSDC